MKKLFALLILFFFTVLLINSQVDEKDKKRDDSDNYEVKSKTIFAQNPLPPLIRDIDISKFQRNKLYISFVDEEGNPIKDLDSSDFRIIEKETGEKVIPSSKIFYDSDEGILICFSMDASFSMTGAPLENVKQGLLKTISKFRDVDKMGLAYFHDDFFKKSEFGTDREILKNNINDLSTGGSSTELYKSVMKSVEWLEKQETPKRKILIIISDGDDNGKEFKLEQCLKEIRNSNITVFTIGSIKEQDETKGTLANMEEIASASKDGKYYKIKSPEDISKIIPMIYDRIKDEYLLEYWSYVKINTDVTVTLEVKYGDKVYSTDTLYTAPEKIVENAPAKSFWKTKEFLLGVSAAGIIIAGLIVFLILNISKKKKFRLEKEKESELRRKEADENRSRYNQLHFEYESLLSKLENQQNVSESEKIKISKLEQELNNLSKTVVGIKVNPLDIRRRTQILSSFPGESKSPDSSGFTSGKIKILEGFQAGRVLIIGKEGLIIGRSEGNLILNENIVSRKHAIIYKQNEEYSIEDFKSTNGTFINNYRITKSVLRPGDIIKIGNTKMQFFIG
ncbi:MAG: VWA domain-containing protein [Ignavibacteria bacterium]|nr:VWA domain-containing protein [Ignavibacteria bacterium]